ncbi:FUSC family protein [Georgenia faecalis]|uniref:FUSC family protein n=1 Tax=Georgenia faecalis TaxID=2483799 RepID=A0ABV9D8Z3_9MICO|nr:FUSC family protein [Georgenia faecalis]
MDTLWLILGMIVLLGTLLDVFLTALNYDESGYLAGPVARLQWRALRRVTRRLPRRWRPVALRQVTGLQIILIVIVWIFGVVLGYGLIYLSRMTPKAFSVSGTGSTLDFFDAMYFSAAQLATVGGSALTAETDLLRFLSIAESLTGVVLISLILTFLLGVYDVIGNLNTLCTQFFTAERGAGSPVASLAPYFRRGEPDELDGHLDSVSDAFASYSDGLRLHHAAYYFQSGRDQFALPYALRMTGGTLGALRWGLPSGHPATASPALPTLTFQFLELGDYLQAKLGWTSVDVPEVVSAGVFAQQAGDGAHGRRDEWVARFVELEREMAALAGGVRSDPDDSYRRYTQWLPFAYRAQQITLAVSRDLDYQPLIVTDAPVSLLHPEDALALESVEEDLRGPASVDTGGAPQGRVSRWRTFAAAHLTQVDPGQARLRAAARALIGAVAAVATVYLLLDRLGERALEPAIFAGFVAMLSTGIAVDRTVRGRRLTSVLVLLPIAVVVLLGGLLSDRPGWMGVVLVVVALVGVGIGRFGPRWAALGRVTFMAYYFALILRLELSDVGLFILAAVVGAVWAYLVHYVVLPDRPRAVLRGGVEGFSEGLADAMDALVDAVSWARWDPDVRRRVAAHTKQMHRGAALLVGQLRDTDSTGMDPARGAEIRLRVFDTELAAVRLMDTARAVTGTTLPLELRARLAGRLELLQAHLRAIARRPVGGSSGDEGLSLAPWHPVRPPVDWPPQARALSRAVDEMHRAAGVLRDAEIAGLDPHAPPLAVVDPADAGDAVDLDDLVAPADPPAGSPGRATASLSQPTRRAVQAAVATGVALGVGDAVSASHQYWATLAAYQVLGGTDGETFVKATQRIAGTVAGAVVGFALAIGTGGSPAVLMPVLAIAVFASTYFRGASAVASTFWTTMIFAVIYEFLGRLTTLALEIRVLETLFGAVVALLVARWVFPTHTRTKLSTDMATLVGDVSVVVAGNLERLAGNDRVSPPAIYQRLLVMNQHARAVNTTAAPLRRSAGALEPGGIEAQLTAAWSLAYYTRHLTHAVDRVAGAEATDQDWARLRGIIGGNLAALTAALDDRLPGPVQEDLGLRDDALGTATRLEESVLRLLERINQTVVLLLTDVSPGAVTRETAPI